MSDALWTLTIRRFSSTGAPEEIAQRIRQGLLPSLRQAPGFRAYYVARVDGGGGIVSATIFEDEAAADRATEQVLAWTAANLADLVTGAPVVTRATLHLHFDAERPGLDSYMLVRMTEGLGPANGNLPVVQERLVPISAEQPGFRHLYIGRDRDQAGRGFAVSIFTNRSTATAAHAQVAAAMAQRRDLWPQSPQVLAAGEVIVAAVA
ncbi:antibiotic biosynthesis monooxygenase [Roseicella frigidaeris]|uniref:antibiotic biosynthesis monooxygenase n=1 Tax=Roseicella frigidaeris TaxID=2230885 RepID=UPI001401C611|nr:antibiotic biosynthesis monooxygenase [Roseicella frigidaeris]